MKNMEVVNLYRGIEALKDKQDASPRFSYALIRNQKILKDTFDALVAAGTSSDEYKVYDEARIELCRECSVKDAAGNPTFTVTGRDYVIRDRVEFDRRLVELQEQHQEVVDANDALTQEVKALMDEDVEALPSLVLLPLDAFPPTISPRQMEALMPMVDPGESIVHDLAPQV